MPRRSAGLILYRPSPEPASPGGPGGGTDTGAGSGAGGGVDVLLVHPGGPFWARKDDGAWSIPKGEVGQDEDPLAAAEREVAEELGLPVPPGPRHPLGDVVQRGGKRVSAWAVATDLDVTSIRSNTFELEWPPRSGHRRAFPEVDRAGWFTLDAARAKILPSQAGFLDRLVDLLSSSD